VATRLPEMQARGFPSLPHDRFGFGFFKISILIFVADYIKTNSPCLIIQIMLSGYDDLENNNLKMVKPFFSNNYIKF
jgi:hypothetical protein